MAPPTIAPTAGPAIAVTATPTTIPNTALAAALPNSSVRPSENPMKFFPPFAVIVFYLIGALPLYSNNVIVFNNFGVIIL
jgi:hypothetical protein